MWQSNSCSLFIRVNTSTCGRGCEKVSAEMVERPITMQTALQYIVTSVAIKVRLVRCLLNCGHLSAPFYQTYLHQATGESWDGPSRDVGHSLKACVHQSAHPHIRSLETPSIKTTQAIWTSYGSARINATADVVWAAVRDFESWELWNEYTPRVEMSHGSNELQIGDRVKVHYRAAPSERLMAIPCLCVALSDADRTFCFRGEPFGVPTWLLMPEKVHQVIAVNENECLYEIFETQSGPMAYAVKAMMGAKQSAMNQGIAGALKKYVEGLEAPGKLPRAT